MTQLLTEKWAEVLDHSDLGAITNPHRRRVTATLLENTEKSLASGESMAMSTILGEAAPVNSTGAGISNYDPVLVSLVRRTAPNMMAYDICGVQAMTGPTQLIFAMRSRLANQAGQETFFNEVGTAYTNPYTTGANTFGNKDTGAGFPGGDINTYNTATGMTTAQAEAIGTAGVVAIPEVAFSIEKVSVTAKSRALKAEYTLELAQDLKAIHGLDAESELSNILQTELLAEINREVVRTIGITAVPGAQEDTTTAGVFDLDTDSNGRWSVEKFKGLLFQIEREANKIAKETRRGKGNIIIASSDVVSAMMMTGMLDYTPALNSNNSLNVDDTGQTYAGVLNGRYKVYIDPYVTGNYFVIGYKGNNSNFDAGLFYCPYVPLQQLRAVDQGSFQPKIGYKTRYGMVANPFAEGSDVGLGRLAPNTNKYYRRVQVAHIM
jgi:hypothetical protein